MAQGPMPIYSQGSFSTALNVTAAKVIKATPGRIARIVVLSAGTTSGSFTINDNNQTGGTNTAANQIFTIAFNGTGVAPGAVFALDFPCKVGITVSAVPSAGSPVIAISYV